MTNQQTVLQNGDIDPNVKLPAAVRAAAARSQEIFNTEYQPQQQEQSTVGETPAAEPAQQDAATQDQQPPLTREVTPTPQSSVPQVPPAEDDGTWEHRYKSLKGRYDKQAADIRAMSEQIQNMQATLAALNTQPTQTAPELRAESLLTQQEIEEYGPEFLEVVGKKAREIAGREITQLTSKISELEARLNGVGTHVAQTARDRMKTELTAKVPQWSQLNEDERFLDWLALPDPYSGVIRHTMLKQAWEQNNTPRVLAFFTGFLSEEAATAPQNEPAPSPSGKVPLETFAAPGRAKTAAGTPAPAEKPTVTRKFITEHYAKAAAGKYRGREAEYERIEKIIASAVAEGRVQ